MNNRICQWVVSNWDIPVCGILLSLLLLLHITSLRHKGLTTDELLHYQYGDRVLHSSLRRTGALDSSTMPFSGLHATTSQLLAIIGNTSGFSVDTSWVAQIKRGRTRQLSFRSFWHCTYLSGATNCMAVRGAPLVKPLRVRS